MELGKAKLQVEVDASGARSGVNDAKRAFDILKRQGMDAVSGIASSFGRLKDMLFSVKGLIGGIGIGLLAKSFLDAGKETENYMVRLRVLLGSVKEGNELFKSMNDYAAKTPFEFREVMGAATQLAGVLKGGVKEITGYMPMIADLAAASGMGIEEATGQVVRMLSAGASAADQFREKGVLSLLGFQSGVKYTAEETRKMLIAAWEDPQSKFRDAAKLLVNTWEGAMSNLQDAWFQFQQRVMIDGGVLDYLKSIVQVLAKDFDTGFGASTDSAARFAQFTIAALDNVVRGIGAVIEGTKFVAVAFQMVKTAAQGISNLWANLTKDVALANAEIAKGTAMRAKGSYESISRSWFSSEKEKLQAKEEYREALEAQLEAETALSDKMKELETNNNDTTKSVEALYGAFQKFETSVDFDKFLENVKKQYEANKKAGGEAAESNKTFVSGLLDFEGPAGLAAAGTEKLTAAQKEQNKQQKEALADLEKMLTTYDELDAAEKRRDSMLNIARGALASSRINGEQYRIVVANINKEYDEAVKKGSKYADNLEDIKSKYLTGYSALKTRNEALEMANRLHAAGTLVGHEYQQVLQNISKEYTESTVAAQKATEETSAYQKTLENAAQGIQSAFTDFFYNIFDKGIKSFKDLGSGILDVFKRTLAEMATLAIAKPIILPIIQAMGGGGGQGQGNILGTFFGQGNGQSSWGNMLGTFFGGSQSGSNANNGGGGGGSYGVLNTLTGSAMGGSTVTGAASNALLGQGMAGQALAYAPYAAAAAGGYYGLTNRGERTGDAGSVGAGLAYGGAGLAMGTVGLYTAAGAAGAGAGATMAGAAGGFSAGLAAIPVIGWVALAMAAIDYFSGGKLFGTRFRPESTTSTLSLGADGGEASMTRRDVRNRSMFRGREWQNVSMDAGDEARDAASEFFDAIQDVMVDGARQLGVETPPMIEAALRTVNEYDKKGKVKSTKIFVDLLGRSWEEATEELAVMRISAEAMIAVVAQSADDASTIAERWRTSAERLAEGADLMMAAQTDINNAMGLLGDDSSLSDVVDLIEDMNRGSETLAETYGRVSQSTRMFDSMMESLGLTLTNSREEIVTFASAITDAAGSMERAQQLYSGFITDYFSEEERRQMALRTAQAGASRQVGDLGDAGAGLTYDNFRERFLAALPTLSAGETVEWMEAGEALRALHGAIEAVTGIAFKGREALEEYSGMYADFQQAYADSQRTQTELMSRSADELMRVSRESGSTTEDQATLFGMLQDRYEMELSYLQLIRDVQAEMNSTIDGSIERIRLSQMDEKDKYEYFRAQANALAEGLATMTDPEQIRRTINRIDELQNSAWGVMDDEGRTENADEFIRFLEGVREIAGNRLGDAENAVQTQNREIAAALGTALDRFSTEAIAAQTATNTVITTLQGAIKSNTERQQGIANQQTEAANTMLDAANIIARTEIRVIIGDNRQEVGH